MGVQGGVGLFVSNNLSPARCNSTLLSDSSANELSRQAAPTHCVPMGGALWQEDNSHRSSTTTRSATPRNLRRGEVVRFSQTLISNFIRSHITEFQCYSSRVKKKQCVCLSMHCLFVLVRSEAALNWRRFCNACAPHHCSIVSKSVGVASG